jgi:hypothetical protein
MSNGMFRVRHVNFFTINVFLFITSVKAVALAILKYTRVRSAYNMLTVAESKIIAKDSIDFLEHLKNSEFNEVFKAKRSAIKVTPVLIHLELMKKNTFVTRQIIETT